MKGQMKGLTADLFLNIDPVLSIIVILVTSNLLIRSEVQNILAWPSYGKCNIQKPKNQNKTQH